MLSPAERILRCGPPVWWDSALESAEEDSVVLDADSDEEDSLGEGDDGCGCFVLSLNCPIVAMFLTRMMDRAAPQSTKAKVAPFHNFILERGGALKLCRERGGGQSAQTSDTFNILTFKHGSHLFSLKQTEQRPFH